MLFYLFIIIAIYILYNHYENGLSGDDWAIYFFLCFLGLIGFFIISCVATAGEEVDVVYSNTYELVPNESQQYIYKDSSDYFHMYYWDNTGLVHKEIYENWIEYEWDDTYTLNVEKTELKDGILQTLFIDFAGDTKYILHIPKEEYERIYVNEMFKQ